MVYTGNGLPGAWKQLRFNLKARARLRRQHAAKARSLQLKYVTSEQLGYADILDVGVTVARFFLAFTFVLYVFGFAAPKVPFSELPAYWSMPVGEYLQATGVGTGWSWLALVGHGDYMNLLGIAFLAGLTIACYLRVLPFSLRRKEFVFGTILILEIIVLSLAASGLLATSH
jgi:hypothetical protein